LKKTNVLGIDIGGTGIKAAIVDTVTGVLLSERIRVPTPQPSTPDNVAYAVKQLVHQFDYDGIVGCGFPSIMENGKSSHDGNMGKEWINLQVDALFQEATGLPFVVQNDADVAAVAEMELGAGKGVPGMVVLITIGTGLGSGVFYNGVLIPNVELGLLLGRKGQVIEQYASNGARKKESLSWKKWGKRFNFFLEHTQELLSPNYFILGGGVSKKFEHFKEYLTGETPIRIARFQNNAGIIGAALVASNSNKQPKK
jgi:polyphosphate glucokinase